MKNERFLFDRGEFGRGPRARWIDAGFGPPPFGGCGPRRRRRGDVRLALLMLLSIEGPLNGYQLMQRLEERSEGRWRPSPGSVYPALQQLEDEGLIRSVQAEGDGRAFELTDAGRANVSERGEEKPPWQPDGDEEEANPRSRFRSTIGGLARTAAHVFQDGTPEQVDEALTILDDARRKLYRLLAGDE
jgi:DNA-binding PadR family transcriptional regulator